MRYYAIDPANYISAPGLAWDSTLLKTSVELELINDAKTFRYDGKDEKRWFMSCRF